jgi:hypothetical protein
MPDNLTVEISANSGKLRADLTLLQKQLRDVRKDLTAAATAGDTAKVNELSLSYEKLSATIRGTSRALQQQTKVVDDSKKPWSEMAVGVKEAVAAFAGLAAVRKVVGVFGEVADKITEISNTAKAAALSPGDVQVFQEVIEDTGESADGARQALVNLTDQLAQTRIKAHGFSKDLATGINVLRGSAGEATDAVKTLRGGIGSGSAFGVEVKRGSEAAATSVEELTEKIKANAAQFSDNRKRIQSVFEQLGKLRKQDAQLGTAVGVQLLGRRYAVFAEAIDRLAKGESWEKIRAQLIDQGRYIDENKEKLGKEYKAAVDDLGDSFEKLKFAIAIPLFPNVSAGIRKFAELIENIDTLKEKYLSFRDISGLAAIEDNIAGPIRRGIASALDALRQFGKDIPGPIGASFTILADLIKVNVALITGDLSGALKNFKTLATDVWTAVNGLVTGFGDGIKGAIGLIGDLITWLGNLATKAATLPSWLFGGVGTAQPAVPGAVYASGGMVRGPGSGTSDSIMARLSNGEYVMRAAAVRAWGPQLLSAMNALKRPLRAVGDGSGFADGGLVTTSSDGVPVHLHFPGGSQVQLHGDKAIVRSLLREARRAGMVSAGRSMAVA